MTCRNGIIRSAFEIARATLFGVWLCASPALAETVVTADLVEYTAIGPNGWYIDYRLAETFEYEYGHGVTIFMPDAGPLEYFGFDWLLIACGWDIGLIGPDPNLSASEWGLATQALPSPSEPGGGDAQPPCPGTKPSLEVGVQFVLWNGEGLPSGLHRFEVTDADWNVVETGTIQVPEPAAAAAGMAALSTLAILLALRRRGRLLATLLPVATLFSMLSGLGVGSAARATVIEDGVVQTYSVGSYIVDIVPVEVVRRTLKGFEYTFDVTIENTGDAAGAGILNFAISKDGSSVRDGFLALPAMGQGEIVSLAPLFVVFRRSDLFEPEDIQLCLMAIPQPGGSPPESDLAVATLDAYTETCVGVDKGDPDWRTKLPAPPLVSFTENQTYYWNLETEVGSMKFRLLVDVAPQHAGALIYLTRLGFYEGRIFHRVITNFMAQGGGALSTGGGSPGHSMYGEFAPGVEHDVAGTLSTAHAGRGTDGSQFFITFGATPWLDGLHTISARMEQDAASLETLQNLRDVSTGNGQQVDPVVITSATISLQ